MLKDYLSVFLNSICDNITTAELQVVQVSYMSLQERKVIFSIQMIDSVVVCGQNQAKSLCPFRSKFERLPKGLKYFSCPLPMLYNPDM